MYLEQCELVSCARLTFHFENALAHLMFIPHSAPVKLAVRTWIVARLLSQFYRLSVGSGAYCSNTSIGYRISVPRGNSSPQIEIMLRDY